MLGAGEEYQSELGVKIILKAKSRYQATQEVDQVWRHKVKETQLAVAHGKFLLWIS